MLGFIHFLAALTAALISTGEDDSRPPIQDRRLMPSARKNVRAKTLDCDGR